MKNYVIEPKKLKNLQELIIELKETETSKEELPKDLIQHFAYIILGIINKRLKKMDTNLYSELMLVCINSYEKYKPNYKEKALFSTYLFKNLKLQATKYINQNIIYANKLSKSEIDEFTKLKNKVKNKNANLEEIEKYQSISLDLENIKTKKTQNAFIPLIEEKLQYEELLKKIKDMLDENDFNIFKLKVCDDYNYTEISDIIGISKQAVRKSYNKTIEYLKNKLKIK